MPACACPPSARHRAISSLMAGGTVSDATGKSLAGASIRHARATGGCGHVAIHDLGQLSRVVTQRRVPLYAWEAALIQDGARIPVSQADRSDGPAVQSLLQFLESLGLVERPAANGRRAIR